MGTKSELCTGLSQTHMVLKKTPTSMDPKCLQFEQKMAQYLSNISRLTDGKRQHGLDKHHHQLLLQQTSMIYKPTDQEIKPYLMEKVHFITPGLSLLLMGQH